MAIQIPDPGTGNGASGDNEFVLWTKVKDNFTDQTNAASRLVGTAGGNVMQVGAFGLGGFPPQIGNISKESTGVNPYLPTGFSEANDIIGSFITLRGAYGTLLIGGSNYAGNAPQYVYFGSYLGNKDLTEAAVQTFWTTQNATKDSNGFLKGASPVIDMYDNKIGLNHDAEQQGDITFEKLDVGDYLVKGSLGFAQEGWYIETPKDANGNVLVAVVYEQLENNDLSIKTYAKKFDDETGDIVANLLKSRDIPVGRFISLRLHELPKEPPVMPTETQTEV